MELVLQRKYLALLVLLVLLCFSIGALAQKPDLAGSRKPEFAGSGKPDFAGSGKPEFAGSGKPGFVSDPPNDRSNQPPIALDDDLGFRQEDTFSTFSVAPPGVFGNDEDPDGDPLSVNLVEVLTPGVEILVGPDGAVLISILQEHFNGDVKFIYEACDPLFACDTATASFFVVPVDDPPFPQNDQFTVFQDAAFQFSNFDLVSNDVEVDGDVIEAVFSTDPLVTEQGGQIKPTPGSDTLYQYMPPSGFLGLDTAIYDVCDKEGDILGLCSSASVSFDVGERPELGWVPVPQGEVCQARLPAPSIEPIENDTLTAISDSNFESYTATDYQGGTQYDEDNPVPGGVYIGALGFTCIYSMPYSGALWDAVVSYFDQQAQEAQEYLRTIPSIPTEPFIWEGGEQLENISAGWELSLANPIGSYPPSGILLPAKFGITVVSVNDPAYPEIPDSLRNAIRITIKDGGRQALRDAMVDLELLLEEDRYEWPEGTPLLTIDLQ